MRNYVAINARTFFFSGTGVGKHFGAATVALLAASTAQPAAALIINPVYDSSITSLANASTIESAFNTVAQDFATQFTNNAQINVRVSWGHTEKFRERNCRNGQAVDLP